MEVLIMIKNKFKLTMAVAMSAMFLLAPISAKAETNNLNNFGAPAGFDWEAERARERAIFDKFEEKYKNESNKQCSNLSFAGECDDISKINKNCLSNYSSEQLNDIIASIKASADSNGIDVPTGNLQLAWLCAAQIAKDHGYPIAGSIVEASVKNYPFQVFNGQIGTTIKSTNVWKNYYSNLVNNNIERDDSSFAFEKYDNADLFFALHNVEVHSRKAAPYVAFDKSYNVNIHDVFDFEYWRYNDLFVTLINNWAWLCQQAGVLNPITVDIDFNTGLCARSLK